MIWGIVKICSNCLEDDFYKRDIDGVLVCNKCGKIYEEEKIIEE